MVETTGVEPVVPFGRRIYSPLGLPIFLHLQKLTTGRGSVGPSFKSTHGLDCDSPIKLGDAWENRTPVSG